jgi:hypothetical protein
LHQTQTSHLISLLPLFQQQPPLSLCAPSPPPRTHTDDPRVHSARSPTPRSRHQSPQVSAPRSSAFCEDGERRPSCRHDRREEEK